MLGGPYAEKLAPLYEEFRRWRDVLENDFATFLSKPCCEERRDILSA